MPARNAFSLHREVAVAARCRLEGSQYPGIGEEARRLSRGYRRLLGGLAGGAWVLCLSVLP